MLTGPVAGTGICRGVVVHAAKAASSSPVAA
jgi:hypothetical protein